MPRTADGLEDAIRQQIEELVRDAARVVEGVTPRVAAILRTLRRIQHDQGPERQPDRQPGLAVELPHAPIAQRVESVIADVRQ